MAAWFADLTAQAEAFGNTLTSEVTRVTAHVSDAVRDAQSNLDKEAAALRQQEQQEQSAAAAQALLPWELYDGEQGAVRTIPGLMEKVLALSLDATTFESHVPDAFGANFDLMAHISAIEELLELDPNLSAMQARHSATMDEDHFWSAYFFQCEQLKVECLADAEYEKVNKPAGTPGPAPAAADEFDAEEDHDVDDDELEAAIEAELMAEEHQSAAPEAGGEASAERDREATGAYDDDDELEMSSGEIIDAEDELDDDELEAQIAAELGFEDD